MALPCFDHAKLCRDFSHHSDDSCYQRISHIHRFLVKLEKPWLFVYLLLIDYVAFCSLAGAKSTVVSQSQWIHFFVEIRPIHEDHTPDSIHKLDHFESNQISGSGIHKSNRINSMQVYWLDGLRSYTQFYLYHHDFTSSGGGRQSPNSSSKQRQHNLPKACMGLAWAAAASSCMTAKHLD